ncbi:MAG TPA: NAD-binding protein [Euzebya sp.]|nr:NAD-binding protein [Euzebya sp.]
MDVLQLAGCDEVLQQGRLLGRAMARRVLAGDRCAHVIGEFGDLRIAEASISDTELCGAERSRPEADYVLGDAADVQVLQRAGLDLVSAVLITTHSDDVNVYLTLYLRRLRPDVQVISLAVLDRNVSTLHRPAAAGRRRPGHHRGRRCGTPLPRPPPTCLIDRA